MALRQPLYIDSCVFIAAFESTGPFARAAKRCFEAFGMNRWAAMTSELTLAELTAPIKNPKAKTIAERRRLYLDIFENSDIINAQPIRRSVLLETAELRSLYSLRLADAVHVATALSVGCQFFLSCDRDARRLPPPLEWVNLTDGDVDRLLKALDA